jgi:D-3-phosphoglycerate dehydrogenase
VHRILIADTLHQAGLEVLSASGAEVRVLTAEDKPRLLEIIPDFDALVVRSSTQVTEAVLAAGTRLKVVGRAGIGVDNVDVAAATDRGILVVNAPTANLISATEHTFALMLGLSRQIAGADAAIKRSDWDRKTFVGQELQLKTLGIVGFGRIGQQVARRARAFDMKIVGFDPFLDPAVARDLDVELMPLKDLLAESDVVTLHVPLTDETRNLLGTEEMACFKPGAYLVNCARGGVVDEDALLAALESGALAGAAIDVFAEEPPTDWRLAQHPRVLATPHIGAQTREAQERIALETARMVLASLDGSLSVSAVNLPFRSTGGKGEPFLRLGEQLGRFAGAFLGGRPSRLQVDFWGVDESLQLPISVAALRGMLTPFLGEAVNFVNAEKQAADRGIELVRSTHQPEGGYSHIVGVTLSGEAGSVSLRGTFFGDRIPRVVNLLDFRLEFRPEGRLLVLRNQDVPGVVGRLGRLLGEGGVNIAEIHLARDGHARAMAVLRLDQEPSASVLEEIASLSEISNVRMVDLTNN